MSSHLLHTTFKNSIPLIDEGFDSFDMSPSLDEACLDGKFGEIWAALSDDNGE